MNELEVLQKLLEVKESDIKWTKKRLDEQTLELEMIQNRIILNITTIWKMIRKYVW